MQMRFNGTLEREFQMTNIKKFLKRHTIKELVFFNSHSNLAESYLCEVN